MKYNYNQIQDFLNDESFVRWVIFRENQIRWQQFLIENSDLVAIADEAQQYILEINSIEEERALKLNKKNVWDKVLTSMHNNDYTEKPMVKFWQRLPLKWAASLIIMFGISWLVWNNKPKGRVTYQALVESIESTNAVTERINKDTIPLRIELEDGSIIDFLFTRTGKREVYLKIVRMPEKQSTSKTIDYRLIMDLPILYNDLLSAIDKYTEDIRNNKELSDVFNVAFETRRKPEKEEDIRGRNYIKNSDFDFIYRLLAG